MLWRLLGGLTLLGMQGVFYFLLVVSSVPGKDCPADLVKFLNISFLALPSVCALCAAAFVVASLRCWPRPYAWVLLPLVFAVAFLVLRWKVRW